MKLSLWQNQTHKRFVSTPSMQPTIENLLSQDQAVLVQNLELDASEARIEVQMLLQRVLKVGRAYLFAHPERILNKSEVHDYIELFERRRAGEPMAYLLGEREFFGLNLKVTSATLIPRPDTELLVEQVLERIHIANSKILDMGTGSGAIALALAHQRSEVSVWACDASIAALTVARENAKKLAINNVQFVESNWFSALSGQHFDVIVSNPPYIAAEDIHLSQGDVRFEPLSALASGVDGLDDIRHIVQHAGAHLNEGGWLLLEHGYDQSERVRELLIHAGFAEVFSARDLSDIERCSGGKLRAL
ncbi:MAG: peptide chain release factor N(5)-glutamine methyltransferase [Gallionellaceae bacterium]|nr:peptide chain release factor N(5)-glutamine methyltransferase [Gallionellaceae bacterium]